MIVYSKHWFGIGLLFRIYGSIFPRTIPAACLAALYSTCLVHYEWDAVRHFWVHPYPYQVVSFIIGFLLVFRCSHAYNRYWEARQNLQLMQSKWGETALELIVYDKYGTRDPNGAPEAPVLLDAALWEICHLMSLLHALACQALRRDPDLGNLKQHGEIPRPVVDPIHLKSETFVEREVASAYFSRFHPISFLLDLFNVRGAAIFQRKYHRLIVLPVIDGLSREEQHELVCDDVPVQHDYLAKERSCCEAHVQYMQRPYILLSWIKQYIVQRVSTGGLPVPPPLVQRVLVLLSEGMQAYELCRKVSETPFPFPIAQLDLVLLLLHTATVPLIVTAYIRNEVVAVFLSVLAVVAFWAISEVSRELEDPFTNEPNDLPLAKIQYDFNQLVLNLCTSRRPATSYKNKFRAASIAFVARAHEAAPQKGFEEFNRKMPRFRVETL